MTLDGPQARQAHPGKCCPGSAFTCLLSTRPSAHLGRWSWAGSLALGQPGVLTLGMERALKLGRAGLSHGGPDWQGGRCSSVDSSVSVPSACGQWEEAWRGAPRPSVSSVLVSFL